MTRSEIHSRFVSRFATGPITPSTPEDVGLVETALATLFPRSFTEFATRYGAIHTPEIEELVVGAAPSGVVFDVQEFLSARDMVMTTEAYRSAGMDEAFVLIATDSMGNVFGFRAVPGTERPDDATVYLFDHASGTVSPAAPSFDAWLQSFLDLKP
jgi:hypothetical protein